MSIFRDVGSGGALVDAPPLDFIEFLAGELLLPRRDAELLLSNQLRGCYTAPIELEPVSVVK